MGSRRFLVRGLPLLGQKLHFLVHLPYLLNCLEFNANILIQSRSWAELVPLGGLVDFGFGGSIFGAKNYVFGTFAISLEMFYEKIYIFCKKGYI